MRAIVVGAGVIGLSIAWRLSRADFSVTVFTNSSLEETTSWVAGGMLAPYCEATYNNPKLLALNKKSLGLYPKFIEQLREDSNSDISLSESGTLYAALDQDDRAWLRYKYEFQTKEGMPVEWLSGEQVRELEPLLSPKVVSATWVSGEQQIDNRQLLYSLREALKKRGIEIVQGTITDITKQSVVTLEGETHNADVIINSAGARASKTSIDAGSLHPVKGQIVSLHSPTPLRLNKMIRTQRIYIAPKENGLVRVGATEENKGLSRTVTAGALLYLLQHAWEAVPAISEYYFKEILAGSRPVTLDHMPIIGKNRAGIYNAFGHGRSGILLAPYTADYIVKLVQAERCMSESLY